MKKWVFFLASFSFVACTPPPTGVDPNAVQNGSGEIVTVQTGTVSAVPVPQDDGPSPLTESEKVVSDLSFEKELSTQNPSSVVVPAAQQLVSKKPIPAGKGSPEKVIYLSDLDVRDGVLYGRDTGLPFNGKVLSLHAGTSQKSQEGSLLNGRRVGIWIFYDKLGNKWAEGGYKDGKPEGKLTRWHPNGQKSEEGNFLNGVMEGPWFNWNALGQMVEEKNYKAGMREGRFTIWYDNGQKKEEKFYRQGKIEGKFSQWYDTAQLFQEANYILGNLDGKFIAWYQNGQKKTEGTYIRGKTEGKWVSWYQNGMEQESGNYLNGKRHATWKFFNDLGEDIALKCFDAGVEKECRPSTAIPTPVAPTLPSNPVSLVPSESCPADYAPVCGNDGKTYPNSCLALQFYRVPVAHVGACVLGTAPVVAPVQTTTPTTGTGAKIVPWAQWWPNGVKKEEGILKNGLKDGRWVVWHSSGAKAEEGNYVLGQHEGSWLFWHKNGQKKDAGSYLNGKKDGFWTSWYENGQKMQEGNYVNGMQKGQWLLWYSNGNKRGEKTY